MKIPLCAEVSHLHNAVAKESDRKEASLIDTRRVVRFALRLTCKNSTLCRVTALLLTCELLQKCAAITAS